MPDIFCRLDAGHPDHPKIRALERTLGANALAYHVRLMCYAAVQRPAGLLVELTDRDVARIAHFRGRPDRLIEALLYVPEGERAGLAVREGRWLRLYHYQERQMWLAQEERRARDRLRKRAGKIPLGEVENSTSENGKETEIPPGRVRGRGRVRSEDLTPPTPQGESADAEHLEREPREPPGFAEFWSAYPRRVGKLAARRAYERACRGHPERPAFILAAITAQVRARHFRGRDGQDYIPNPATWLNGGRWEDAIGPPAAEKPPGFDALIEDATGARR